MTGLVACEPRNCTLNRELLSAAELAIFILIIENEARYITAWNGPTNETAMPLTFPAWTELVYTCEKKVFGTAYCSNYTYTPVWNIYGPSCSKGKIN